ncbi:MAG: glycosyltransferase [Solobacterium sp.]|nr:glycosyltransferase [Solobacterium sp.]
MKKRKICIVVQRYGLEVNGGAEALTRMYAERLKDWYDVLVVTTKALDYMTWEDWYTADEETINGVKVRRFSLEREKDMDAFQEINDRFMQMDMEEDEEPEWIDSQGPYVPGMIRWLKEHYDDFECFLFFTYLYYPTVIGLPEVKDKAILIPFAHDEPFLSMSAYRRLFESPRAILFSTQEERQLIRMKFENYNIPCLIGGAGVTVPSDVSAERFEKKYGLKNFILYVGRIDAGKNCEELFEDFSIYKEEYPSSLKLVLMGKEVIEVPKRDDVVSLGFVDEQDKFDGLAACDLLVLPSKYESLSMVVLEAFKMDKPVLVNGQCEVLKAHCDHSHGGLAYLDRKEFFKHLYYLEKNPDVRREMGRNGRAYVRENYQWETIMLKLSDLIEEVCGG